MCWPLSPPRESQNLEVVLATTDTTTQCPTLPSINLYLIPTITWHPTPPSLTSSIFLTPVLLNPPLFQLPQLPASNTVLPDPWPANSHTNSNPLYQLISNPKPSTQPQVSQLPNYSGPQCHSNRIWPTQSCSPDLLNVPWYNHYYETAVGCSSGRR